MSNARVNVNQNPVFVAVPGIEARVSGAAVSQYALVKIDSTGRRVMLAAGDAGNLMVGIAMNATTAAGQLLNVLEVYGIQSLVISDGTATITAGQLVVPSATVAGRVMQGSSDPIATALETVAATVGITLGVL